MASRSRQISRYMRYEKDADGKGARNSTRFLGLSKGYIVNRAYSKRQERFNNVDHNKSPPQESHPGLDHRRLAYCDQGKHSSGLLVL